MAGNHARWAWSKSTRIMVMLVIDTAFFLLELIAGFLAGSLALTADAFHMLNDIISLAIGLWAVVAAQKETTDEYTFGWVRAEILGAFFNAVFLIALCVSIILEALTRLVWPPEIRSPKLILIVGCAGLFSNLLGFFVLGGHGHSHGHEDDEAHLHSHGQDHDHEHQDQGSQQVDGSGPSQDLQAAVADERGPVNGVLPEVVTAKATRRARRSDLNRPEDRRSVHFGDQSPTRHAASPRGRHHRSSSKGSHSRFVSVEEMSIHPASRRQDILAASLAASHNSPTSAEDAVDEDSEAEDTENTPLTGAGQRNGTAADKPGSPEPDPPSTPRKHSDLHNSSVHNDHNHTRARQPGAKASGHSHADMGMNAMMLHVLSDALGNVGVIATALIIWLTDWPGKHYADPAVSFFITVIILKTSIPLTLATARVLLQATPDHVSIQEIRQDIGRISGVNGCHHIHVWQLSDTKIVASLHLQVAFPNEPHSGEKYMQIAKRVRRCLHAYGIHSATIQPEFSPDPVHQDDRADHGPLSMDGAAGRMDDASCLLECVDECKAQGCCPTQDNSSKASSTRRDSATSQPGTSTSHR